MDDDGLSMNIHHSFIDGGLLSLLTVSVQSKPTYHHFCPIGLASSPSLLYVSDVVGIVVGRIALT